MDERKSNRIETEPFLLFKGAKNDIIDIQSSLKNEEFPIEEKAYKICFNATRAAEKMLKGYIRFQDDEIDVKPIHNLDYLYDIALDLNDNFKEIKKDLDTLDPYKSWTGYEPILPIKKQEVIDVLYSLKNVYEFPAIKKTRDICHNLHGFNTLPDNCMEIIVNMV